MTTTHLRPFWLTEPCPAWCRSSHQGEGFVSDRYHSSEWRGDVTLTLVDIGEPQQREDPHAQQPITAQVYLEAHVREIDAHVCLETVQQVLHLTQAEARRLAETLALAVDLAEGHWGGSGE